MLITKNVNIVNCRLWANLRKKFLQLHAITSVSEARWVPSRGYAAIRSRTPIPRGMFKVFISPSQVLEDIENKAYILVGGYGLCGLPETLLTELSKIDDVKELTVVCADAGTEDSALSLMLRKGQIKRVITSSVKTNHLLEEMFLKGLVEVTMIPQGTLAGRLRAGGSGVRAFYTPVGAGTLVEDGGLPVKYAADGSGEVLKVTSGRETREFEGVTCVLEEALRGHFALVRAWRADEMGNLCFRKTGRNFNTTMCKAARIVIAEVDEILPEGGIPPESIQLPGIYVDRIVCRRKREPRVETVHFNRPETIQSLTLCTPIALEMDRIAKRVLMELRVGMCIHLGPGVPMHLTQFIPPDLRIILHCESGVVGMGPYPDTRQQVDPDLVNGCKEPVTEKDGTSYVSCDEAFAMVTGGHIDLIVIDALEVSQYGDVANWSDSAEASEAQAPQLREYGSAMDLVAAKRENTRVVVAMTHLDQNGRVKIVPECSFPLTGRRCVDLIITEKGVFGVDPEIGLTLLEKSDDVTVADLVSNTEITFEHADKIKPMMQMQMPVLDERLCR